MAEAIDASDGLAARITTEADAGSWSLRKEPRS
jgi:hypothetical protein